MLLAVVRVPADASALSRAASVLGLPQADVQRRIAGQLPRVVLVDADANKLCALQRSLEQLGFACVVTDPEAAPTDAGRVIARRLEASPAGFVAVEGLGAETRHEVPVAAIALLQRGVRLNVTSAEVKEVSRKLSVGRAVMTGGLALTKKVEKTTTQTTESREPFVVVQRSDGGKEVILYERRLDYRFLGRDMQPSSFGNLQQTIAWLRRLAPGILIEDRVARPGFLGGMPSVCGDPVDVGLHVVRLARAREGAG